MLKSKNLTIDPIKHIDTLGFIFFITSLVLLILENTSSPFIGTRYLLLEAILFIGSIPLMLHKYIVNAFPLLINFYSYLAITFALPFCLTFMYLNNPGFKIWSLLLVAGSIVLTQCIKLKKLWPVILVGCFVAILITEITNPNWTAPDDLLILSSCCFVLILYFSLLSLKVEREYEEKIHLLETISSTIAHELRTPLASVRLVAYALEQSLPVLIDAYQKAETSNLNIKTIDPPQLNALQNAVQKFYHICAQANMSIDLLLKNTSNPKKTTTSWCNAKTLITHSIEEYPMSDNDKSLVTCNLQDDFFFLANENMMKHVIFNILKNAFYHSKCPTDQKITISLNSEDDHFGKIIIKDTGTGIDRNNLPFIFDRFFTRNNKKGTGLGLHYCKTCIEQFGGKIICKSEPNVFTEFTIYLPKI